MRTKRRCSVTDPRAHSRAPILARPALREHCCSRKAPRERRCDFVSEAARAIGVFFFADVPRACRRACARRPASRWRCVRPEVGFVRAPLVFVEDPPRSPEGPAPEYRCAPTPFVAAGRSPGMGRPRHRLQRPRLSSARPDLRRARVLQPSAFHQGRVSKSRSPSSRPPPANRRGKRLFVPAISHRP